MNLLQETIEYLNENNKSIDDVLEVFCDDFKIYKNEFIDISSQTEYDSGFGGQEVASDLKILGMDFVMIRHEYDGSERWEFISLNPSNNYESIKRLASSEYSLCTVKELQEGDK